MCATWMGNARGIRSKGIDLDDADALTASAEELNPVFDGDRILLEGRDVTTAIRAEEVSAATSRVAAVPGVRAALLIRWSAPEGGSNTGDHQCRT